VPGVGLFPPRQRFENVHQVVGQRRRKFHPMSVTRVRDREPLRVQERPIQTLHRAKISRHTPVHTPVRRVADDWMPDCAEMHANLVSPAGVDRNAAQCHAAEMACPRDPCDSLSRTTGPRRHFLPVNGIATDCGLDSPPGLNYSPHESDIFLFDFAIVKLSRELLVCQVVLGNHHHAGRSAIQAMNDPGPGFTADPAQIPYMVQKRVHESAGPMARTGMDHHSCLFVQHGDVAVLIQDFERERLASHTGRLDRRDLDAYEIALVHRQVGAGISACDRDVPRGDQFLNLGTRMPFENGNEELIEPVPIGIRWNGELERHGCRVGIEVKSRRRSPLTFDF
jgi:hypothetical protein